MTDTTVKAGRVDAPIGDWPVLLHPGLHKCASTWLQKKVFAREDLGFCSPWGTMSHVAVSEFVSVDPLVFDATRTAALLQDTAAAPPGPGQVPVLSHEALSSRPHHGHYYAPQVAERLHAVFPRGRVLVMFREQRGLILSLYGEHIRNGGRLTLTEFLGTGQEPPGWVPHCRLSFFHFDRLFEMYAGFFGRENVLFLPLEMLRDDPAALSARLLGFCGLPEAALETASRSYPSWTPWTQEFYRRSNGVVRKNPLGPRSGPAYRLRERVTWKLDALLAHLPQGGSRAARDRFLSERIGTAFHASNRRLSDLLGIDLAALGYPVG